MRYINTLLAAVALLVTTSLFAAQPVSFKLYSKPHADTDTGCDRFTLLKLTVGPRSTATLSEGLDGFCEVHVEPNLRTYSNLTVKDDGCGSKIYKGSRNIASEVMFVTITDNRSRLCDNIVPAMIVVTEKTRGFENTVYSADE